MIRKLEWDSEFFGYPVGVYEIKCQEKIDRNLLQKEAEPFKLVYLITDEEIKPEVVGTKLVDIKTVLCKEKLKAANFSSLIINEFNGKEMQQLKNLALQSGIYSRFKTDNNFVQDEFEKLYIKWIEDSINKTIADQVIVCRGGGDEYKGFVTLIYKENVAVIGLFAVAEYSRGQGIGLGLLNYVNNIVIERGIDKIEVTTQFHNKPAMNLYHKAGYEILSKKYIYHLWT